MGPETIADTALEQILRETGRGRDKLPAILRKIQDRHRYLPREVLRRLAEVTSISASEIEGVSTFFPSFRRTPAGRHTIRVCVGTACFVKGADQIHEAFREQLGIEGTEDTDREGMFTVEKAACLGCCMLAPVARIDDVTFGHLERQQVPAVLRSFLESRARADDEAGVPSAQPRSPSVIRLCTCTSCRASGAGEVFDELVREVGTWGLAVAVQKSGCAGISYRAPLVDVTSASGESFRYAGITPEDVPGILLRHFRSPRPARQARRIFSRALQRVMENRDGRPVPLDPRAESDSVFWTRQQRIVTEDPGTDPLDLDGYIRAGGFDALRSCCTALIPEQVIGIIDASGLRGRGGAGYPTGKKWKEVRESPGRPKVLICNADEGDPGAFMDRLTLESFPFRVIEGMTIAAYAVGASRCLFFIRTEYPLAISRIDKAIEECRRAGLLDGRARGIPVSFSFELVEGAGAFVCGEETAMIASLEGRRGNPRSRPPYPARSGLDGLPTLVNNVETFAAVPWIIAHGAREFRSIGCHSSPGTKTFALAGKVKRGGLIEVPMGMTLRQVVEEIGGGVQEPRTLKAVQVGGPSGGCIPAGLADLPIDFESLAEAGGMMGSGGMVVLDDADCMVNVARYFLSFSQRESCGACTGCRIGTRLMLDILEDLCAGKARPGCLEKLDDLAVTVRGTSLCGLGRSSPNPVLSTLRHFRAEYEAHLQGRCPAGQCRDLISLTITDDCIGCTRCAQRCPTGAVAARPYEKHTIDPSVCIRCGTCRDACPSNAVVAVPREAQHA